MRREEKWTNVKLHAQSTLHEPKDAAARGPEEVGAQHVFVSLKNAMKRKGSANQITVVYAPILMRSTSLLQLFAASGWPSASMHAPSAVQASRLEGSSSVTAKNARLASSYRARARSASPG